MRDKFTSESPQSFRVVVIGHARTSFKDASSIPKGLGARHEAEGWIDVLPKYEEGLTDIDGFSHLFIIWVFHQVEGYELLVTPPSDIRSHGVFATRSPFRPNPIGLTVVRLIARNGGSLFVKGVDMLDGSPVLDIKPYLTNVSEEDLRRGWLEEVEKRKNLEAY